MRGPGEQRWRGRGGTDTAAARQAAVAAKEAAAHAFYEMDQAQRYVGGRVTVFTDLDPAAASAARTEFARLHETADTAAAAYIRVVDAHDVDDPGRSVAEYDAAMRAMQGSADRLVKITGDLNAFAGRLQPEMARLEAALDRLPPRLAAARDALAAAEREVAGARDAGFDATDPEHDLTRAREGLALLNSQGLGGLGLSGALDQAEQVRELADAARAAAADLPKEAERVGQSLTAVRTRVQVVQGRLDPVRAAMRTLLRNYSQACWQDLRGSQDAIGAGIGRAQERIDEAAGHVGRGEWRPAKQALTAARTELTAADRRARTVLDRLAELDEAATDPAKPAEATRFVVRDAQKLVVTAGSAISPGHARTLDALVARLESAPGLLTGTHPDYWAYLQELRSIGTAARDVIERVRAERATG